MDIQLVLLYLILMAPLPWVWLYFTLRMMGACEKGEFWTRSMWMHFHIPYLLFLIPFYYIPHFEGLPAFLPAALYGFGLLFLYYGWEPLQQYRLLSTLPEENDRDQANGVARFTGTAEVLSEQNDMEAPMTGTSCLGYSLSVREEDSSATIYRDARVVPFLLQTERESMLVWPDLFREGDIESASETHLLSLNTLNFPEFSREEFSTLSALEDRIRTSIDPDPETEVDEVLEYQEEKRSVSFDSDEIYVCTESILPVSQEIFVVGLSQPVNDAMNQLSENEEVPDTVTRCVRENPVNGRFFLGDGSDSSVRKGLLKGSILSIAFGGILAGLAIYLCFLFGLHVKFLENMSYLLYGA